MLRFKRRTVDAFNWVEFNPSTLARRLKRIIRPSQTRYAYTSSVRLRFIRRTNDEINYCRTVDELIRCDNYSSFKTGVRTAAKETTRSKTLFIYLK